MADDLPVRPAHDSHRRRFAAVRYRAALARVEAAVLVKRFTPKRSTRLDRAVNSYEKTGGNAA